MIHYALRCSADHGFEGWFNDSASFETQAERGFLECPVCGDKAVTRALMAPALPKPRREKGPAKPAPQPASRSAGVPAKAGAQLPAPVPAQLVAMLQRIRAEVESRCDYVGGDFADEARRMHRGESERHGIYGETTPDEAEALRGEGIEIASIPWVPRAEG